jgi:hypothetical protein
MHDILKTQPKDFWKYISKFKNNDHVVTQFKVGKNVMREPTCIAEAFAGHFSSIFNSSSSVVIPNNASFILSNFLNVPSISDSDVKKAIRRLSSSKSVGPDEILSFIIKGCSHF